MTRKKLNLSNPGDATHFGSDDTDKINDLLTGGDQSSTDPVTIATTTTFNNGKLLVKSPANSTTFTKAFGPDGGYGAIVWTDNAGNYYAKNGYTGAIVYSGTVAEQAIIAAFGVGAPTIGGSASMKVMAGNYMLSAAFAGFNLAALTGGSLLMDFDQNTLIVVRNGYSGNMFNFDNTTDITIRGGYFTESNTANTSSYPLNFMSGSEQQHLWTCFNVVSVTAGIVETKIVDANVAFANNAIQIGATAGTGFTNSNWFSGFRVYNCVNAVNFVNSGGASTGEPSNNIFEDFILELDNFGGTGSTVALYGFKGVTGTNNTFINCVQWDQSSTFIAMSIAADGNYTQIIGGNLSGKLAGGSPSIVDSSTNKNTVFIASSNSTNYAAGASVAVPHLTQIPGGIQIPFTNSTAGNTDLSLNYPNALNIVQKITKTLLPSQVFAASNTDTTYIANDITTPTNLAWLQNRNKLQYGDSTHQASGTITVVNSTIDIQNSKYPGNELGNFFGWQVSNTTAVAHMWFTDFSIHGPIAVQPSAMVGVSMFCNNYYNGSPTDAKAVGISFVTLPNSGGGAGSAQHAATVYAWDIGMGISGYGGTTGTPARGITTALQIGGASSIWMGNSGSSWIGTGITIKDVDTNCISILEPRASTTPGAAILIVNSTTAYASGMDLSGGKFTSNIAIKLGTTNIIEFDKMRLFESGVNALYLQSNTTAEYTYFSIQSPYASDNVNDYTGFEIISNTSANSAILSIYFNGASTWQIEPSKIGTGTLYPLILAMNTNSIITINTDNSMNFNSRTISNAVFNNTAKLSTTNTTGAVTATLGANAPAGITTTPFTWIQTKANDGSTVYIPVWK